MNAYLLPATTQTIITPQLLERGLLTPDQLSEVLSTATSGRLSEEATIAKLGLLSREDLRETVLGKVKWITTELIEAASVRFRVSRLNRLPGQAKSDDSENRRFKILLEELEGKAWGEMAAEQESFMECLPQLSQRPDLLANNLGLSDDSEQFLSECIDGESTLKAVYRATNLTRAKSFATVFALHQLGHLTFATPEADEAETTKLRQEIEHRSQNGSLDDFEYLNLSWLATQSEIDTAIVDLERDLAAERCAALEDDLAKRGAQVLDKARAIYDRLRVRRNRQAYRKKLLTPEELGQAMRMIEGQLDVAEYREDQRAIERLNAQLEELSGDSSKSSFGEGS